MSQEIGSGRRIARQAEAQRMAQEGTEAAPGRSARRVPFGAQEQQLAWPPIDGFRLYWFNDTPGRIGRAKAAGYEHVTGDDGKPVARTVGRAEGGGGFSAYLMKIPVEWYYEDMAHAQAERDGRLRDIKEGRFGASAAQNQYVPEQGIKIDERR